MRLVKYRGKWCAYWRENGKPRRISLKAKTRKVAEQRLADLIKYNQTPADTVAAIMTLYMTEKAAEKPGYVERMTYAWKALEPHFGHLRPDQITRELCRKYNSHRGLSGGTVNLELNFMKTGLRWHNPNNEAQFFLPKKGKPRERHLTREEYSRLLAAASTPHIRLFIILALATAGRSSAILELTWDRVDFERGIIRLQTDGEGKGRATVPMTESAREALKIAHRDAITDYVIEYGGKPLKSVKKAFSRTCDRADLEGVSPHVLRHTSAVWLSESGVPMSEVAQYLGHSDSRITERVYARYSPEYLRKAAKALET